MHACASPARLLAADMPYGVLAGQGAAVQPPAGGEAAGGGLGRGPSVDESMHRLMGLAAEQVRRVRGVGGMHPVPTMGKCATYTTGAWCWCG